VKNATTIALGLVILKNIYKALNIIQPNYNQKFSIFVHAVKHFLIEDHYITINGLVNI
tara:strand:- start:1212 stop:1385 length:174 start_codon:yes stop_codon:yes gene_type:complete